MSNFDNPEQGLRAAVGCGTNERTHSIHVTNETQATITVAFFQVISGTEPPHGYVADTGVMGPYAGSGPGAGVNVDPCAAVGSPIIGHLAKGSINVVEGGQQHSFNLPDRVANPPQYWQSVGWTLRYKPRALEEGGPKGAARFEVAPSTVLGEQRR
jgi:hypothetical protein